MKNNTIFHLKIIIFTAMKYHSILHGRVCVMLIYTMYLQETKELSKSTKQRTPHTEAASGQKRTSYSDTSKPFQNRDKKLKPRDFIKMRKERKKQKAAKTV